MQPHSLREEIFGLVSEGRGIRQTGIKIPEMVTLKYLGAWNRVIEKVVKIGCEDLECLQMSLDFISYSRSSGP